MPTSLLPFLPWAATPPDPPSLETTREEEVGVLEDPLDLSLDSGPLVIPDPPRRRSRGSIGGESSHGTTSALIPEFRQDLDCVFPWLEDCYTNHPYCSEKATPVNDLPPGDLFLIDLEDGNRLVKAKPDAAYVTLSYVWASAPRFDAAHRPVQVGERIPAERMTQLFVDVSHVARKLAARYLWIDKFCIAQHDNKLKHRQFQQMRIIYRNSLLCIVAVDADAETRGLPGISRPRVACRLKKKPNSPRRRSSLSTESDTYLWQLRHASQGLIAPMCLSTRSVQALIKASKWWSRAWTYQEHCLSRRCLVFTDEQFYFECNRGQCRCEAEVEGVEEVGGIFQIMRPSSHSRDRPDKVARSYREHLEEFTRRDLRYESQALNAFVGIVKHHQMIHPLLQQVSGIPFFASGRPGDAGRRVWWGDQDQADMAKAVLPYSLAWAHRYAGWCEEDLCPRPRELFPKWSPLGWTGEITYEWEGAINFYDFQPFAKDFAFELHGNMVPYEKLYSSAAYASLSQFEKDTFSPRVFSMRTVALPANVVGKLAYNNTSFFWTVCGFPAEVSLSHRAESPKRANKMLRTGELRALLLGDNSICRDGSPGRTLFMIVGRLSSSGLVADLHYTRLGLLTVMCSLEEMSEYFSSRRVDFFKPRLFTVQ